MVKQLKFVISPAAETGMATLNFQDLLTIKPHSQIAMDKFFMTTPASNNHLMGEINIPDQVVYLNENVNGLFTDSTAAIPAGNYTNITALLNQFNQSFNSTLNTNPTPIDSTQFTSDAGFQYRNWVDSSGTINIGFLKGTIDQFTDDSPIQNNMITDGAAIQVSGNGYYSTFSSPSYPLIQGGIYWSMIYDKGSSDYIKFGLFNPLSKDPTNPLLENGEAFGLCFHEGETNPWTFFVGDKENVQELGYNLNTGDKISFFVSAGDLKVEIETSGGDYYYSDAGIFEGFNFNTSYGIFYEGNLTAGINDKWDEIDYTPVPTSTNQYGVYIDPPPNINYISTTVQSAQPVIVKWDWTDSLFLQTGLGLGQTVYFSPQRTSWQYSPVNTPNFVTFYDFALETSSLPLQTFQARTNQNGQRRNVIAYFSPIPLNVNNSNTYYFDSKHLDFIDLENEYPITLNSLSFRVFDVNNDQNITASYMSFNLFVKSPDENLVKLLK